LIAVSGALRSRAGRSLFPLKPTVIVLGVDSPTGLAVVRNLGRTGVKVIGIGWQIRAVGLHSRYCAVSVLRNAKKTRWSTS